MSPVQPEPTPTSQPAPRFSPLFFQTLVPSTPGGLRTQLLALPYETVHTVDALLRFVLGAGCPAGAAEDVSAGWDAAQTEVKARIEGLIKSANNSGSTTKTLKRGRDEEMPSSPADTRSGGVDAKRTKTSHSDDDESPQPEGEDPPLFTLHALSLTSPIRKKADITVHARTLRLTNPTTHAPEHAPILLERIRRAFLLPTRGKAKPHWTVVLLGADVPREKSKGKAANGKEKERERSDTEDEAPAVVFGVDAVPSGLSTTAHAHIEAEAANGRHTAHPKGTPVLPSLRAFLSHLPLAVVEPSADTFRSSLPGAGVGGAKSEDGMGATGVEAYRGAKPGTLWFLREGILWDGRPIEFFPMSSLAKKRKREARAAEELGLESVDAVRTVSATGRTCSVIVRRDEGAPEGEGQDHEEDLDASVVEVDFGMVDGKEQEGIAQWVRKHRHLFGRQEEELVPAGGAEENEPGGTHNGKNKGKGKERATEVPRNPAEEDTEDEEDDDYVNDDSSDGGSATSDSDESESGDEEGDGEGDAVASGDEDAEGEGVDDEEEEEFDPRRHPLLRPSAMPKMSRAAIEAAVGIVERDMLGGSLEAEDDEDGDDEVDELDE